MIGVAEEVVFVIFERYGDVVADLCVCERAARLFAGRFLHRLASW